MGEKFFWVKAKTKVQLKQNPELKIKVVSKTSERKLGGIGLSMKTTIKS